MITNGPGRLTYYLSGGDGLSYTVTTTFEATVEAACREWHNVVFARSDVARPGSSRRPNPLIGPVASRRPLPADQLLKVGLEESERLARIKGDGRRRKLDSTSDRRRKAEVAERLGQAEAAEQLRRELATEADQGCRDARRAFHHSKDGDNASDNNDDDGGDVDDDRGAGGLGGRAYEIMV